MNEVWPQVKTARARARALDPAFAGGQEGSDPFGQSSAALRRDCDAISRTVHLRARLGIDAANFANVQAGRSFARQAAVNFFRGEFLFQFQFGDLVAADNSERQGESKDQARFGMEARAVSNRQGRAAEQALEAAHQIVVANQAQVAVLAKTNAEFCKRHAGASRPGPSNGPLAREWWKQSMDSFPDGVFGVGAHVGDEHSGVNGERRFQI